MKSVKEIMLTNKINGLIAGIVESGNAKCLDLMLKDFEESRVEMLEELLEELVEALEHWDVYEKIKF